MQSLQNSQYKLDFTLRRATGKETKDHIIFGNTGSELCGPDYSWKNKMETGQKYSRVRQCDQMPPCACPAVTG